MDDTLYPSPPWKRGSSLSEEEMETLRRRAWREQSVLIVSPYDERLSAHDRVRLFQIGNCFYGESNFTEDK